MDGQKSDVVQPPAEESATKPAAPAKAHHSFMDIRLPKRAAKKPESTPAKQDPAVEADTPTPGVKSEQPESAKPAEQTQEAVAPAPAEDLVDDPAEKLEEPKKKAKAPKAVKPPKAPRQPGVGLAIFATVIIVLGLAALATYAYLVTNGQKPF